MPPQLCEALGAIREFYSGGIRSGTGLSGLEPASILRFAPSLPRPPFRNPERSDSSIASEEALSPIGGSGALSPGLATTLRDRIGRYHHSGDRELSQRPMLQP